MKPALLALTASLVVAASLALAGCPDKAGPKAAPSDAGAAGDAAVAVDANAPPDGKTLATNACMSCHTDEMLRQQRLTKTQWAAVVKKMAGWGANLEPAETAPLVDYLTETYGPDAGSFVPVEITTAEAAAELAELDDGPFAGGDAARGKELYAVQCGGCHAPNGRGQIGTNLVDRPILRRAREVAVTVRKGRGKMTPLPTATDAQIADLVAHLRTLR